MVQTLHPGVYTLEIDSQPKVTGVGATTAGFIGLAEKGPNDKAVFISSFQNFQTIFGSYQKKWFDGSTLSIKNTYLAHSVEAFFKSGGSACWIVRPTISGSSSMSGELLRMSSWVPPSTNTTKVATISGLAAGAWYNTIAIDNQKAVATSVAYGTATNTIVALTAVDPTPDTITYSGGITLESAMIVIATQVAGTIANVGLTNGSTYFVTKVSSTVVKLSDSFANYLAGTYMALTADATATFTLTPKLFDTAPFNNAIHFSSASDISAFEPGDLVFLEPVAGSGTFALTAFATTSQVQMVLKKAGAVLYLAQGIKSVTNPVTQVRVRTASRHRKTIQGLLSGTTATYSSTYLDVDPGLATGLIPGQELLIAGTYDGGSPNPTVTSAAATGMAFAKATVEGIIAYPTYDRILLKGSNPLKEGSSNTFQYSTGSGVTQITGSSTSTTPVLIVSLETSLNVYYNGSIVEQHQYLSYNNLNERDYIGDSTTNGRLYGTTSNESNYIQILTDTTAYNDYNTVAGVWMTYGTQLISSLKNYSAGDDGTFPTTSTGLGISAALPYLKDAIDLSMLACPDISVLTTESEVRYANKVLTDYGAVTNPDVMVYITGPNIAAYHTSTTAVQSILDHRNALAIDTSRAAFFWPYMVCPDPTVVTSPSQSSTAFSAGFGQSTINLPPQGFVMGQTALITAARGPHVAAANVPHVGVFDVTFHVNDPDQDLLNPRGVNCIRQFPGQGIRTWGARTLYSVQDGRHYIPVVRLLQFIERSVREGNRFAVFQPNDPLLWAQVTAANVSFLSSIWQQGMLFPSDDEDQAYFVKCDAETNPPSERAQGRLNCIIGVNPPKPAEFVIFRVGIFDGAAEIQTLIQGANAAGFLVG